ncbi:MAG: lysophospholipid acyltransferase family protein [Planctomycetes bacterium]|nr:lysophospholipid acyltransferase family protein [Planctomycetota bacterium]
MARSVNTAVDWLLYVLVRVAGVIVQMLPVRTAYALGRAAGSLAFALSPRHRRRALEHVAAAFPDWPADRVRRVARESMQSVVLLALEAIIMPRRLTPGRFADHLVFAGHEGMLRHLLTSPDGAILLTGHFGNWEVGGYALASLGFPAAAVARPLDNAFLDRYVRSIRQQKGLRIVDKRGAAAAVDAVLHAGGAVAFIADQDAGRRGVFVDFFGRPASTFRSIALLALRYEVPIFVTYARRLDDAFRFEIGVAATITPDQWAGRDDPVHWITQTYTRHIEQLVRTCPGQYFGWLHRRWKHQPKPSDPPLP